MSPEIKSGHDGIQVDDLSVVVEGVVPIQQDVAPRRWRNLRDQLYRFGIAGCLVLGQQPRKDRRVVVDDRVGDQPGALVADLNFDIGTAGQLFFAADLRDGRAQLVIGLDAVL